MTAQLMLLAFTLIALAFPLYGLKYGKLPGGMYYMASRSEEPIYFWTLFAGHSFLAGCFVVAFIGRAIGLIQ